MIYRWHCKQNITW